MLAPSRVQSAPATFTLPVTNGISRPLARSVTQSSVHGAPSSSTPASRGTRRMNAACFASGDITAREAARGGAAVRGGERGASARGGSGGGGGGGARRGAVRRREDAAFRGERRRAADEECRRTKER